MIGPGSRHAPHDAFGIRAGSVAMLARLRSVNPHLGVSSPRPVDDQHDLVRVIIGIRDDLLDQQARDALLDAHLAAGRIPHRAEIGGKRFEGGSIDQHGGRREPCLRLPSPFKLADPFERAVPARFELRGHETVVRVDSFVASRGERRLVVGLLQFQRQRAVLVVVVLLGEVARFDRGL